MMNTEIVNGNGNGGNVSDESPCSNSEKQELLGLLKLIKKYNLKGTQELLCKEANIRAEDLDETNDNDIQMLLNSAVADGVNIVDQTHPNATSNAATSAPQATTTKPKVIVEGGDDSIDPKQYETSFADLRTFVEESLDIYKHELSMSLYPILVQIYFKMIASGYTVAAREFVEKYKTDMDHYYYDNLQRLLLITKPAELEDNDFVSAMDTDKFIIRMSRDSHSLFKRHIQDRRQEIIADIVAKYLHFDTYEGTARNKIQCVSTAGAHTGEAKRQDNKMRVYYGLLKEVDFQSLTTPAPAAEEEEDDPDAPDKPKKKKPKKDPLFSKKPKSDPNAPMIDRIPLPELKDTDKLLKLKALREATKRVTLNKDTLPSVCFYTVLNSFQGVTCAEISDDSSMLACGFSNSIVRIWSLTPAKLRELKDAESLKDLDKEMADINVRMLDDRTGEAARIFYGHSGPVYRCAFAPELNMLLSCSEDATIRLWSLLTWTCLVVYKGHIYPVWDVRFSPHGYYFASCSMDKTARLWATDSNQPLRMFAGHYSDVDCVQFHPNSNYIASGSSDRTVRLWDTLNGQSVRLMTGHKAAIHSLAFSSCGRYLASGSADHNLIVWDLSSGQLVRTLMRHHGTIHTISFSRDGNLLVAGGLDCCLTLWDFSKLTEDYLAHQVVPTHNQDENDEDFYLLRSYPSKATPFFTLHFTRRNLLLAVGAFKSS